MGLISHTVLTPKQAEVEKTFFRFVDGEFTHWAAKFREVPTAGNFIGLTRAMLIKQAWSQRKAAWRSDYAKWLDQVGPLPQTDIPDLIWARAFEGRYGTLQQMVDATTNVKFPSPN